MNLCSSQLNKIYFISLEVTSIFISDTTEEDDDAVVSCRNETLDWGMHELEAVMDRQDINRSLFTVMTFFGDHALHHLFPTLDHAVLPYLYPVFLDHCQKFRANFRLTTQLDLVIGQIKMTLKTDPSVLKDDE